MSKEVVYVVQGNTGEYSDHREWFVCAFGNETKARDLVRELDAIAREVLKQAESWWDWEETLAGKELREADPECDFDYTGSYYTCSKVEVRHD